MGNLTFKTDDKLDKAFFAETTSKLLLLATNGRFYSLDVSKLPGGRGHGEPIRLFIDMEQDTAIVALFVNSGGRKFLVASHDGQGFIVSEDDCVGTTRKGKQVLNVEMPNEAKTLCVVGAGHDQVAVIGTNHKMIVFPLDQVPEMARGRGVRFAEIHERGVVGYHHLHRQGWPDVERRCRSRTAFELQGIVGLARQSCRRRPPRDGLAEVEQVRAWAMILNASKRTSG